MILNPGKDDREGITGGFMQTKDESRDFQMWDSNGN